MAKERRPRRPSQSAEPQGVELKHLEIPVELRDRLKQVAQMRSGKTGREVRLKDVLLERDCPLIAWIEQVLAANGDYV